MKKERKTRHIDIRLTEKDFAILKQQADGNLSAFCRKLLLQNAVPQKEERDLKELVYQTFLRTKQLYEKPYGRQGYHYIIIFKPGEVKEEQVYKLVKRWCEEYLKDNYDYVFTLHNDHEHIHGHVIFNSVSRMVKTLNPIFTNKIIIYLLPDYGFKVIIVWKIAESCS